MTTAETPAAWEMRPQDGTRADVRAGHLGRAVAGAVVAAAVVIPTLGGSAVGAAPVSAQVETSPRRCPGQEEGRKGHPEDFNVGHGDVHRDGETLPENRLDVEVLQGQAGQIHGQGAVGLDETWHRQGPQGSDRAGVGFVSRSAESDPGHITARANRTPARSDSYATTSTRTAASESWGRSCWSDRKGLCGRGRQPSQRGFTG